MYIPKSFEVTDKEKIFDFVRRNSFAILFSQLEGHPFATHLPLLVDESRGENGILLGHMAKANPHWKNLNGQEVLAVFQGPHAYISPTWYKESNTVPTWNYVAVHIYGDFKLIENKQEMIEIIDKTGDYYESSMPNPWKADFDDRFTDGLMNGIACFEIDIMRFEGKWKLNQNHSAERQQNAVIGLRTQTDENSVEIANLMAENLSFKK
ncbi:FMN-binding negative transcriptional regulator [Bacillus sp. T33-2]|uniref:FMN-binding negative transcriptional regulator n=1 Tax=Bacillus sp. T33-2 TaxID=2054168 RepID=UPI000C777377|nr:FMN-binding negative transcriptional regulator [Bacillus sp. T33-2]PLR95061.1 FMN-binding negative transcriptional regulator [Bacillus sp. T33-2]